MQKEFFELSDNLRNEYLLRTERFFVLHKNELVSSFISNFQSICSVIVKLQKESDLSDISHIEYIMDYGDFIERNYTASVWVFGDEWYRDCNRRVIGEYNIASLFVFFNELWDKLLEIRKQNAGMIRAVGVKEIMLQTILDFYLYLADIARLAIVECVESAPFTEIKKSDVFRVCVGEYMNPTKSKIVYVQCKNKNTDNLKNCIYEDHSNLDFTGRVYKSSNFHYSQFANSCFDDGSLEGSRLTGSNFRKARMENCNLNSSTIHEVDFSYAILKGASITNVIGPSGILDEKKWVHSGYLPVRFCYADLSNANFAGANLIGADFTGANLTDTNFSNANLNGAIFDGSINKKRQYEVTSTL